MRAGTLSSATSPAGGPRRPTRDELERAPRKRVPDLVRPGLAILFCGINPGRYSAAVGHHFAGPGNLFWPTLFAAGFTPSLFTAFDSARLLDLGYGITNIVPRTTIGARELTRAELQAGARLLARKARRYAPQWVAVLGLQAYRAAFGRPRAVVGLQPESLGAARIWLLPNPSGLNATHQPAVLRDMFAAFRAAVVAGSSPHRSRR